MATVQMNSTAQVFELLQEVMLMLVPLPITSQKTQSLLRCLTAVYRHLLKTNNERLHNQ
jgi:hypothetical protein